MRGRRRLLGRSVRPHWAPLRLAGHGFPVARGGGGEQVQWRRLLLQVQQHGRRQGQRDGPVNMRAAGVYRQREERGVGLDDRVLSVGAAATATANPAPLPPPIPAAAAAAITTSGSTVASSPGLPLELGPPFPLHGGEHTLTGTNLSVCRFWSGSTPVSCRVLGVVGWGFLGWFGR